MAEKVATGWKYGPVKNPDAKEHPCMVPYAELPPEQRRKDALYLAMVKTAAGVLAPQPPATPAEGTYLTNGVQPTVGRDVQYVSYGTPKGEYKPAHRAAKITDVRESDQFGFEVRACVFNPEGLFFTGWTHFDESGTQGGTVHWPERT